MVWVYVAGACHEAGKPWAKAGYSVRFRSWGSRNCSGIFSGRQTVLEAELHAAIQAVNIAIRDGFNCLKIHTVNRQLYSGAKYEMIKWMKNNWQMPNGAEVTSKGKWIELQDVISQYPAQISWRFVRDVRTTGKKEAKRLALKAAGFLFDRKSTNILQMVDNYLRVAEPLCEDIQRGISVKNEILDLMEKTTNIMKESKKSLKVLDPFYLLLKCECLHVNCNCE